MMSQWEVYEAIQSLGGSATFAQIRDYLQNKNCCGYYYYSDSSAHDALKKLIYNGIVRSESFTRVRGRIWVYRVTGKFPQRNIIVVENSASRSQES